MEIIVIILKMSAYVIIIFGEGNKYDSMLEQARLKRCSEWFQLLLLLQLGKIECNICDDVSINGN